MDDEDDPVVEEIPVFISNTLGENLFLLQYPIKDELNNFDNADVVNCCVKPYNEHIKIDFAVSTKSKNYDAFRGDQLAQQADGVPQPKQHRTASNSTVPVERPTFPSGRLDKLSYTSSKPSSDVHRYVIGILNDREVHCTPLKSVLQMRPSFSYFDKTDVREKAEQKAKGKAAGDSGGGGPGGAENSESDEEEARQVTVKFQMTERVRKLREQSYEHHVQRQSEEPWCETMWYPSDSGQAELERRKLYSNKADMIGHTLGLDSEDYIKKLIPPERKEISIDSFVPSRVVHCAKRLTLSLTDQIKHILIDAKLANFQTIVDRIDKKLYSKEKILQALTTIGVTLHGNWLIQSDILYPVKSYSRLNGIEAEFMCRARDYILYQFTQKTSLNRQKMADVTQLPAEELKELLQSVAVLNSSTKEWELALKPDRQFEKNNSDIVQRQELVWKSKEEQFREMEKEKPPAPTNSKRIRKRSVREAH